MTKYIATGKTIEGNFQGKPHTSCAKIDFPTRERIAITIDGTEYERTVFERAIYRNMGDIEIIARFVIVDGVQYEITEADEETHETDEGVLFRISCEFPFVDPASVALQDGYFSRGICTYVTFTMNGFGYATDFQTIRRAREFDDFDRIHRDLLEGTNISINFWTANS